MKKKEELIRTIKFVLFSISAGIIEISVFALMYDLIRIPWWPSYLTALVLSVLWNFTFNRRYTFKSANNVPIAMIKVAIFYAIFTPLTTIGGNYLEQTVGWNGNLVTGVTMAINLTTEYLYDRLFVFRKTVDTNDLANKND
ncbi:MAG: GtrA family protein [Eubacterium sp.]|nr:GtrA family protein [Eubacterium sp.]